MLKLSNIKIFVTSFLIVFSSATCKKDTFKFPYVSINANIGLYSDLGDLGPGSAKIFPKKTYSFGGVGGLIVYRDNNDDYFVYDAACTHDYYDDCTLEISPDFQELMVCPCCSSSFLLSSEGSVFNGPAEYPLVEYQSFIDESVLRVVN